MDDDSEDTPPSVLNGPQVDQAVRTLRRCLLDAIAAPEAAARSALERAKRDGKSLAIEIRVDPRDLEDDSSWHLSLTIVAPSGGARAVIHSTPLREVTP